MKNVINLIAVAIMVMAFSTASYAQEENKQRMSREQFAEKQAENIAQQLAFDDATSKRFIETYSNYQKEVWTLAPKQGQQKQQKDSKKSEEETEKQLKEQFEHNQKLLDIRQKYYKEYSKFLTQKQIERVYTLERQVMKKMPRRGQRPRAGMPQRPQTPEENK